MKFNFFREYKMKKALPTLLLVFAMVGFIGLTGSPAGAVAASVYCNPGYTGWIGAPGSEGATCRELFASHGNRVGN
jgi:hypothetical protein